MLRFQKKWVFVFLATMALASCFVFSSAFPVFAQTADDAVSIRKQQLQQQLDQLEKEINQQQAILDVKKNQRVTLERDTSILTAQIKEAKLNIQARNLQIQSIAEDIKSKEKTIGVLSDKIDREKQSLGDIIRKTNDADSYSLVQVLLANKSISEFFVDVDTFDAIKVALRGSYTKIYDAKEHTEEEKIVLEEKKTEQNQLLTLQKLQQKRIEEQEKEKKSILALTKGIEAEYQKILKDKEKSAAAIRSELFTLSGSAAIPFEKALQYAREASEKTGVRPAFILGIIAEESNLGENVGTGSWKIDMKAPRDTVPFLDITTRLGLDPDKMPVSKKPWYGYGGAMGPAQFIPSTWILYEKKVSAATGHNPPNPWDPRDAFTASAILLMENGGDKGTRAAERLAALRYLAGWTNANKKEYAFYGDDVMALADKYQKQIDILGM